MKVFEWIDWLSKQPPENEVLLCDPDTQWLLPLRTGSTFDTVEQPPENSVIVYAEYSDHS